METDMDKLQLRHDAIVFVGDGRKALFLRNEGDEKFANLVTERVFHGEKNPSTHEQGTDRPGRAFGSAHATNRSAMEGTDWHDVEEHRFTRWVSSALEKLVRERQTPELVLVAPPRTLADLREDLHADVKARVVREVHKDLTKIPVWEIEQHIIG